MNHPSADDALRAAQTAGDRPPDGHVQVMTITTRSEAMGLARELVDLGRQWGLLHWDPWTFWVVQEGNTPAQNTPAQDAPPLPPMNLTPTRQAALALVQKQLPKVREAREAAFRARDRYRSLGLELEEVRARMIEVDETRRQTSRRAAVLTADLVALLLGLPFLSPRLTDVQRAACQGLPISHDDMRELGQWLGDQLAAWSESGYIDGRPMRGCSPAHIYRMALRSEVAQEASLARGGLTELDLLLFEGEPEMEDRP